MKLRQIRQHCFECDLREQDLLIDFIKRIKEKKEITYQEYEFDISLAELDYYIDAFKSGNPFKSMNKTEKKKYISVLIHLLDD